jgi:hypothetical protein
MMPSGAGSWSTFAMIAVAMRSGVAGGEPAGGVEHLQDAVRRRLVVGRHDRRTSADRSSLLFAGTTSLMTLSAFTVRGYPMNGSSFVTT